MVRFLALLVRTLHDVLERVQKLYHTWGCEHQNGL